MDLPESMDHIIVMVTDKDRSILTIGILIQSNHDEGFQTIIGGIIKRYSYYMVPYIVAENPNITARQAIGLSRRMMDGHKWDAFVLEISFIGWHLLNGLTFGLSNIFFLNPYKSATFNEYFTLLREEAIDQKIDGYTIFNEDGKVDSELMKAIGLQAH